MKEIIILICTLISIYVNAQTNYSSDVYSEHEQNSALYIKEIENKLFSSNQDYDSLIFQLEAIVSKTPSNYVNSFVVNGDEYIKFWDDAEYESYKQNIGTSIKKLQNVYPYAHYLLSVIKIERGQFEDAYSILSDGIKLEPDQPALINELAFLYTIRGEATKDTSCFTLSNRLFQDAFESRVYNTNSQKARSLRGIGYNLIETGQLANSKLYYEKSLEYEESLTAREEISLIVEKLADGNVNIYSKGSNLDKSDKVFSFEYFTEQENKLPKSIREKIPNKYVNLWSKAAVYLSRGSEKFRQEDCFHYPLKEWDTEQIDAGVIQIVQFLKGVSQDYYLELNSIANVEQLMLTFHFVKQKESLLAKDLYEISFEHKMDRDKITLFFKLKN